MDKIKELEIIEKYKELNSTKKAATACGVSRPTVSTILKKYGIENNLQRKSSDEFEREIIHAYIEEHLTTNDIKEKYKIGKPKIKKILEKYGYKLRQSGAQPIGFITEVYKKYPSLKGTNKIYEVKNQEGDIIERNKTINSSGIVSEYCRDTYGIEIPSKYQQLRYFKLNNQYWWEDYITVEIVEEAEKKKCPYCDWEVEKIGNWKYGFLSHVFIKHGKTKAEYIKEHSEDIEEFQTKSEKFYSDKDNYVVCEICGRKLTRIDDTHLKQHGITKAEYITKYGKGKVISKNTLAKLQANYQNMQEYLQLHPEVMHNTKPEQEITDFIKSLGFEDASKNRYILGDRELDIYIPSCRLAIEYNGCFWHTEEQKGDKNYHLNKTLRCRENGVKLIQIFEDEYTLHKDIVLAKIKHALQKDYNLPRIMARKCEIKEIFKNDVKDFLETNHIQGFASATVYIGAYMNSQLIGVMSCIKRSEEWELNRLATSLKHRCQGVASKMFNYFIKAYKPLKVKSFADIRWTTSSENNLYTKLGFKLVETLKPDYKYYSPRISKYKRFHKFMFRKQILSQKYGFSMDMTENEMANKLGLSKIWDCGLYKYEWNSKSN